MVRMYSRVSFSVIKSGDQIEVNAIHQKLVVFEIEWSFADDIRVFLIPQENPGQKECAGMSRTENRLQFDPFGSHGFSIFLRP